jgi:cell division protein FtsW
MDRVILIVSIILFVFGLFNIVTASSQTSVLKYNTSLYSYFYKQLLFLLIGFGATIVIMMCPTKSYYLFGRIAFFSVFILCILVIFIGQNYSGNQNWIPIGPFLLQPSEFAKPALIMYLAVLFEKCCVKLRNKNKDHWNMIAWIVFVCIIFPVLIIITQKDMGTGLLVTAISGLLFLASPILRKEKILTSIFLIVITILMGGVYILNKGSILSESQSSRTNFYNPCNNYEDGGYQVCNGFIAINSGGLTGVGVGNSRQKSYIPESHTDSVFAIIAEEYGLIVTSLIFFFYVVILYRILHLASVVSTTRGKYICYGVAIYMFLHIFINLGGLFGSMPLTGVPLPYLSYGGSFTIAFIISLAMVQRVHVEYKNEKIKI